MLLHICLICQMSHRSVLPVEHLRTQVAVHLILILRRRQKFIRTRGRHQCLLRVVSTLDRLLPTFEQSSSDDVVFAVLLPDQIANTAILMLKVAQSVLRALSVPIVSRF